MAEFDVEVKETLARTITVEADSKDKAIEQVKEMYYQEVFILDSSDYVNTEYEVKEDY